MHAQEPHGHGVIDDTHMKLVEEPKVALVLGEHWKTYYHSVLLQADCGSNHSFGMWLY